MGGRTDIPTRLAVPVEAVVSRLSFGFCRNLVGQNRRKNTIILCIFAGDAGSPLEADSVIGSVSRRSSITQYVSVCGASCDINR